jgi:hypothetical protein
MTSAENASGAPGRRRRRRIAAVALPAALLSLLAGGPPAQAASTPAVSTGSAHAVGFATATLTGSVDPEGSDTSYFFQYGATRAYGSQTALASAGAGFQTVHVSAAISGLTPLHSYHFRLIAVNATGASTGGDVAFTTTKMPLSLQIIGAPDPLVFGGVVTIEGTLSGTGNGGRAVALQADSFPFTQGFAQVGNPQLTSPLGSFAFPVLGLSLATEFRVLTTAPPQIASPVIIESVAVRVAAHVSRARRPHFARISGLVWPAEDGMQVAILRVVHGRGVLVGGTLLRHHDAASSSFQRVVRVHRGVYRVLVRVTDGARASAYAPPLLIR